MKDCLEALEAAFVELAEGRSAYRRRSDICTPSDYAKDGMYVLKSMDGVMPALGVAAVRINSDIVSFPEVGGTMRKVKVPAAPNDRYTGLVLLFSTRTGEPLAIFPDGVMQPMRVAATSALGAMCLTRDDAHTVAILGCGWQARSQARAIVEVRNVKAMRCYSPSATSRETFAREMSPLIGVDITPMTSAAAAAAGADIVLCATNSSAAVLQPEWIEKGMHLSAIQPHEIGIDSIRKADVVATLVADGEPDYITTHGIRDSDDPKGSLAKPSEDIWRNAITLPTLLSDRKLGRNASRGRTGRDQVTCFLNPLGVGLQFAAVGAVIYRRAIERGRGNAVPTDWFTEKEIP